jgi:hypothetical protein
MKIIYYRQLFKDLEMMLCHSDGHVHFDLWVRGVAIDTKVFKLKIINVVDFVTSNDLEGREGAWLSSKL